MENKDTRVSWDWLSREEKIKRIYEVVWTAKDNRNELAMYAIHKFWINKPVEVMQGILPKYRELYTPKVMIWDVLDWNSKQWEKAIESNDILFVWWKLRQPLEEQSDECIRYLFWLISYFNSKLLETNRPTTS